MIRILAVAAATCSFALSPAMASVTPPEAGAQGAKIGHHGHKGKGKAGHGKHHHKHGAKHGSGNTQS
jgi:hypothetical protein